MMETQNHVCQNCGKPFEPTCHVNRQKFCCDACRVQYHNAKRYYGVPPSECPNCGKTVVFGKGDGKRRRFCNDRCRQEYHGKQRREAKRAAAEAQAQRVCPHCGREFHAQWKPGKQQRFCCDDCRIAWWAAYHKANPQELRECVCLHCGRTFERQKGRAGKYCNRRCYLRAMAGTHSQKQCEWCGEVFPGYASKNRRYCGRSCAAAARRHAKSVACLREENPQKCIRARSPKAWRKQLTALMEQTLLPSVAGKRIFLACGSLPVGSQDVLVEMIRYVLKCDPFNGDRYVFCDGNRLKWLEWDGAAFCVGSRRAERGTYPWPSDKEGATMEISEKEFTFLRSNSIGSAKEKSIENP